MSTDNNQNQNPEQKNTGIPVFDFIFGLLDHIFKDNATGKVLASRVATVVVLFILAFVWVKGEQLMTVYKESRYETYSEIVQKNKDQKFESSSLEQLQIAHVSSGANFSAVYSFRPRNLNYFVDLVAYEGKLPSTVDERNLGGYPVDKTSLEYQTHLSGKEFETSDEFVFLPSRQKTVEIKYMYSCPVFNLDNVYSGTVALYWYDEVKIEKKRLAAICGQAARTLGRSR